MIIDYTKILDDFKKDMHEKFNKTRRNTNWVYEIDTNNNILIIPPKYRKELYEDTQRYLCTIQLVVKSPKGEDRYLFNEKGEFKKIVEDKK